MAELVPRSPNATGRVAVFAFAAVLGNAWTHAIAALLRPEGAPPAGVDLTLAACALAAVLGMAVGRLPGRVAAAGCGAVAGLAAAGAVWWRQPEAGPAPLSLAISFALMTAAARAFAPRLVSAAEASFDARRVLALAWAAATLVGVVQMARLSTSITDERIGFALTTRHPFWYGHECLNAYLFGAELSERGVPDLYDPAHYPGLHPEASPSTRVRGMKVEDPYQYPPQFLLLPRAALALSDHYPTLKAVWFGAQVTLFAAIYAAVAGWVAGSTGRVALLLLPALLGGFPFLHDFQFGQFHLAAVALAAAGMLAFARGRGALGGLLLAASILAKMFPGVLLVLLAARRRGRELAWTAAWGVALTALALLVLGPQPFRAFLTGHLPRLADGSAFAFDEAWPELAPLVVADNQGVFGLGVKLGLDKATAATASRLFALALLGYAALRRRAVSRRSEAALWLGLLGLASTTSPGAWGDYTPVTALWLASLLLARAAERPAALVALGLAATFQYLLLGTMPVGDWLEPRISVATVGLLALLALYVSGTAVELRAPVRAPAMPAAGERRLPRAA